MKHYLKPALLSTIFALFSTLNTSDAQPLQVAYLDFPPLSSCNKNKIEKGILFDQFSLILKQAKFNYVNACYPALRLYKNLINGTSQVWLGIKGVKEHREKVLYSQAPLFTIELKIFTLAHKDLPKTKEEFKNKSFAVIRGFSYAGILDFMEDKANNIHLSSVNSHHSAFEMLRQGRVDYVLDYKSPSNTVLKNHPIGQLKSHLISQMQLHFVVSKKTPNAQGILNALTKSYTELKKQKRIVMSAQH